MLLLFGLAIIVFLIVAIFLFIRDSWVLGATATMGTIVTSGGVAFVQNQREKAVMEEKEAYEDVKTVCDMETADTQREEFNPSLLSGWRSVTFIGSRSNRAGRPRNSHSRYEELAEGQASERAPTTETQPRDEGEGETLG